MYKILFSNGMEMDGIELTEEQLEAIGRAIEFNKAITIMLREEKALVNTKHMVMILPSEKGGTINI